jgi:hypothetical protein
MKLDSLQARKRQPFAISSGVPARFIGVMPTMWALMAGSWAWVSGVSIKPGWI